MSPSSPDRRWGRVPDRRTPPGTAHLRLTHAERDDVAERLKEAYAQGQLDENEFDERLGLAMAAKVQADLVPLLDDLQPAANGPHAPPGRSVPPGTDGPVTAGERGLAAVGHLSGYLFSAIGPLVVLLASGDTSPFVRRHAIEALNYQLTFIVASIVAFCLFFLVVPILAWVLLLLGWIFLPAVGALVAVVGDGWRYPFTWRPVKSE
jgi:uncharacterized Tic20 family protein